MGTNCSESIIRCLIAKILSQKTITEEDYDTIVNTLQLRNDENVYLIMALKYLNLSSDLLDLLIKTYEQRELFFFLQDGEKKEEKKYPGFEKMTLEKALKLNFSNNKDIKLPEENDVGVVKERFQFFNEEDQKYYDCERVYNINYKGQVVDFLAEKITESADKAFHNKDDLYSGILGEDFFYIQNV